MSYKQKTLPTDGGVAAFVASLAPERREEAARLIELLGRASGHGPRMWGPSMVGFGEYRYGQPGGKRSIWFQTGFAARKGALTVYVLTGFEDLTDLMERLGRFTTGKSCLYLKRLSDVDEAVLEELVRRSTALIRDRHPD